LETYSKRKICSQRRSLGVWPFKIHRAATRGQHIGAHREFVFAARLHESTRSGCMVDNDTRSSRATVHTGEPGSGRRRKVKERGAYTNVAPRLVEGQKS